MVDEQAIKKAQEQFGELLRRQLERVDVLKGEGDWTDYSKLDKLIIGVCGGDGIGPYICASAQRVMEFLLADKIKAGKVEIRQIDGLTIERRVEVMKAIPDDTLAELKECHVILKGPTTTPKKGDPWPNIESANVAMRKQLDLFANVRPVSVPELGINWVFYRENTEGSYALGSDGMNVTDDLAMDFCVATKQGTERIIRAGFEHAKKTGVNYVSLVTKANIIKTTDGKFLSIAEEVAKDYPEVKWDDWFIDITTAKLIDPAGGATSRCSSSPTSTAISSPMRLRRSRAVSERQVLPTSERDTPCSRPSTVRHPGWSPREGHSTPIPAA